MEIVLLIIAGIVLYYLYNGFQDYMKNPYKRNEEKDYRAEYNPSDNPYVEPTKEDRIKKTEYGVLAGILQVVASSDGKVCNLEKELISDMLDDMANELADVYSKNEAREVLQNIFDNNKEDADNLASAFAELTKGEYKKRLKLVEFLFAVAYADGNLDDSERDNIIDIAAILELNNDDFNKIYDDFEAMYSQKVEMNESRALEILALESDYTKDELESSYKQRIKDNKQNILSSKNLNKNFREHSLTTLRDIDEAYNLLIAKFNNNK